MSCVTESTVRKNFTSEAAILLRNAHVSGIESTGAQVHTHT